MRKHYSITMEILKLLNLGLRFVLELCLLVILGFWGFSLPGPAAVQIGFGIGSPIGAAILWGLFISPRAPFRLDRHYHTTAEVLIFFLAGWALYCTGRLPLAIIFLSVYAVSKILMLVWKQDGQ